MRIKLAEQWLHIQLLFTCHIRSPRKISVFEILFFSSMTFPARQKKKEKKENSTQEKLRTDTCVGEKLDQIFCVFVSLARSSLSPTHPTSSVHITKASHTTNRTFFDARKANFPIDNIFACYCSLSSLAS